MESGMDVGLSECGMVECKNGHVFLEEYKLDSSDSPTVEDYRLWLKEQCKSGTWYAKRYSKYLEYDDEEFLSWFEDDLLSEFEGGGVSSSVCPVCQFVDLPYEDVAKYYLKTLGITRKAFAQKMKNEFSDYGKFSEFIKETK